MGLKALLEKAAKGAITAVGDLAVTVTFRSIVVGNYNPTTGSAPETVRVFTFPGVLTSRKINENDSQDSVLTATKLIVASLDIPAVVPRESDNISINGKLWEIVFIKFVPGDPIYIFTIRLP